MIIKDITIQNFKSFGNNQQSIKFANESQLILLQGNNGSGKSSILETIDFCLYGVVRGKERKKIPQTELPNRNNGSLLASINFINEKNENVYIERGLKPLKLKILLNSNDITNEYKQYEQEKKENIIGINYEIYKSFISMSLNDFTNFINLEPDTKRKLLNKLFNLDELDSYYEITKNIIKNNKKNIDIIKNDILNNLNVIKTYKTNIKNIKNYDIPKKEIKETILSKKSIFTQLKEDISNINTKLKELNIDIDNKKYILNNKNILKNKLELKFDDYSNKIDIFEKGNCPICDTYLKDINYVNKKILLTNEKDILNNDIININNDIIDYNENIKNTIKEKNKLLNELKDLNIKYKEIQLDLINLKNEFDNFNLNNKAINEINKNIEILFEKNIKSNLILKNIEEKNIKYEQLNEIFSINGLRKDIIDNIIKPINNYLIKYLKKLDSPFRVEIDNEFNANLYERFKDKIHPETLSSGEARKINMSLALSYIEIIKEIKNINVLFLDEIFANVDSENIDIILKILKEFSKKYNINVIIISQDHTPFDIKLFDRIITIEKNMFSIINEKNINEYIQQ